MNYIEKIVELIIRPNRDYYHTKKLGDPQIIIETKNGKLIKALRQDRIILNKHNQHIHLSFYQIVSAEQSHSDFNTERYHSFSNDFSSSWFPQKRSNQQKFGLNFMSEQNKTHFNKVSSFKNKCVIYLHANNGSRIQGKTYLMKLLEAHCNVCLFDCSGSGVSQGNYVTLGLKQARDLDSVVNFLVKEKKIQHIALWGRSMGSATALIYGSRHANVKLTSMVLDSPFKDLQKLIKQIASDKTGLPKMFFQPLLPFVKKQIQRKTGYNIAQLKLKRYLQSPNVNDNKNSQTEIDTSQDSKRIPSGHQCRLQKVPVMFVLSKRDKFVKCHHGEKLYKRYPCVDKQLHYIDIEHHQSREQHTIDKIVDFIVGNFNKLEGTEMISQNTNHQEKEFQKFSEKPAFTDKAKLIPYWNQTVQKQKQTPSQREKTFYNPQKTLRARQYALSDSQIRQLPYNLEKNHRIPQPLVLNQQSPRILPPCQKYLPQIIRNQQYSPKTSQVNYGSKSFYHNAQKPLNFNDSSYSTNLAYNTPYYISNNFFNPQFSSNQSYNTFPKPNQQHFQVTNPQSPFQKIPFQSPSQQIQQHHYKVLLNQSSHSSLTTKARETEASRFVNESFKHFSLDKNHYQPCKPGEGVKLRDFKFAESDLSPKLMSKKYKTSKNQEKISLSSTIALQQKINSLNIQQNLINSNGYQKNDSTIQFKANACQTMPKSHTYVPQYPTNHNFPIFPSRQPSKIIIQSPMIINIKISQATHPKFQNSLQFTKFNWNTSSQTNPKSDTNKSQFAKQQITKPSFINGTSIQRLDPVYMSLIDTRDKAYPMKVMQKNDLKSLSNRKVESKFTSRIFTDPKEIPYEHNQLTNHQINLNESFVFSLQKLKDIKNAQPE